MNNKKEGGDYLKEPPESWEAFQRPPWDEFWGRRTDENIEYLDALYYALAQWISRLQEKGGNPPREEHGLDRRGRPCERCERVAWNLLSGPLGELLTDFGKAAYVAGREGQPEADAADDAIRVVCQRLWDTQRVEDLLFEESLKKSPE